MWKTTISPRLAFIAAAFFFLLGVWDLGTDELWRGLVFMLLALAWVVIGGIQFRKRRAQKIDATPLRP